MALDHLLPEIPIEPTDATSQIIAIAPFAASISGSLMVRSSATDGKSLRANVVEELDFYWDDDPDAYLDAARYRTGVPNIVGADGCTTTLNADTGDLATVEITLQAGDEREMFQTAWSL